MTTEHQEIRDNIAIVMGELMPYLLKLVATARPDTKVYAAGNPLAAEPADQRDYRREVWIATFNASPLGLGNKCACANEALAEFDKRFPK